MNHFPFSSTDANGQQRCWSLEVEENSASRISVRVWSNEPADFYEARFVAVEPRELDQNENPVLHPDILTAHSGLFEKKGITTALFRRVAELWGRMLVSSRLSSEIEWISAEMYSIWEHYRKKGWAIYSVDNKRYEWRGPQPDRSSPIAQNEH